MKTLANNKLFTEIVDIKPQFIDLIRKRLGIVMHAHQDNNLIETIYNACEIFHCTPTEYLNFLINCSEKSPLLDHLVAGITVGETYFFRDKQQMDLLKNELLPQLIKNKRDSNKLFIRIWSAGCASGEEIYTIAMLLLDLIPDIEHWTIKLLATDVNTLSLQKAIAGIYSEWSMRSIPDYFRHEYFIRHEKSYHIVKKVGDMVTFDYLNLNDNSYPSIFNGTNSQDLILCRNVLIYFDSESCARLMHRLNASLVDDGYLMLGASDPISIAETDFVFHPKKGLLFSRKQKGQDEIIAPIATAIEKAESILPKITRPHKLTKSKIHKPVTHKAKIIVSKKSLSEKAIELANHGKLDQALEICKEGLKSDPTNTIYYYIYALTLLELNKMDEAESYFRKSLFLDNQFVAAHFQLGMLLLRKKEYMTGLKCLQNALSIAEAKDPSDQVIGSPGLCYQKLAEILRNEMNLYVSVGVQS